MILYSSGERLRSQGPLTQKTCPIDNLRTLGPTIVKRGREVGSIINIPLVCSLMYNKVIVKLRPIVGMKR